MPSSKLHGNLGFLYFMGECSPRQRKLVVKHMTPGQLEALREVCVNLLEKNIPVSDKYKKVLNNRIGFIRLLASKGGREVKIQACLKNIYIVRRISKIAKKFFMKHGV